MGEQKTINSSSYRFKENYTYRAYKAGINQNIMQSTKRRFRNKKQCKNTENINDNIFKKNRFYRPKYSQTNYQQRQNLLSR